MAAFQAAGVSSSGGVRRAAPAQLTRMSAGPRRLSMASTIAAALSADVRSAAKPNTPPSSAQARSILADEREEMPTRAPSETNMRAQARPIPFEPPVTTTLLPRNPRSIVRILCPHYTVGEGRGNEKDRCLPSSPQRKTLKRRRLAMSGQHIGCVFNRADCVQEGLDRALNLAGLIGQGQHPLTDLPDLRHNTHK